MSSMSSIDIQSSNHTMRRHFYGFFLDKRDTLGRTFIPTNDCLMPITEVDSLFSASDLEFFNSGPYWGKSFSLNKRELFTTVIAACDEYASKKTTTYDKKLGLDEIVYEVPALNGNSIVKYTMYINRGKHRRDYSLEMDCIMSSPYRSKRYYRKQEEKGMNKQKHREFVEICNM